MLQNSLHTFSPKTYLLGTKPHKSVRLTSEQFWDQCATVTLQNSCFWMEIYFRSLAKPEHRSSREALTAYPRAQFQMAPTALLQSFAHLPISPHPLPILKGRSSVWNSTMTNCNFSREYVKITRLQIRAQTCLFLWGKQRLLLANWIPKRKHFIATGTLRRISDMLSSLLHHVLFRKYPQKRSYDLSPAIALGGKCWWIQIRRTEPGGKKNTTTDLEGLFPGRFIERNY